MKKMDLIMDISLKRKCTEESNTGKLRFLANLQNLEQTPKNFNRGKSSKKQSCDPNELFKNFFEKSEVRSTGFSLKNKVKKKKNKENVKNEVIEFPQLSGVFSKLAVIPEKKIEIVEMQPTDIDLKDKNEIIELSVTKQDDEYIRMINGYSTPDSKIKRTPGTLSSSKISQKN